MNSSAGDRIDVVTLTRRRRPLLERAIASVAAQTLGSSVRHIVVIDDCRETERALAAWAERPASLGVVSAAREPWEVSGPGRASRLRNMAARMSGARWIAFLDDDNEWLPEHLETLLDAARTANAQVAHSHAQLFFEDGRPYTLPAWPWGRDPDHAAKMYSYYVERGVYQAGSHIARDRIDPPDLPDPVRSADTSSLLFSREVLLGCPFTDVFSAEDGISHIGEDDKIITALSEKGVRIVSSQRATLKYFLGGYSNNAVAREQPDFAWR